MLRPLGTHDLASLRQAASAGDVALDHALMHIGILPPADLDEIRSLLSRPQAELRASTEQAGHRVVDVIEAAAVIARVHNDGSVTPFAAAFA